MSSALLCMELRTKLRNSRDNRTWFGIVAEDERGIAPAIEGGAGIQLRRRMI